MIRLHFVNWIRNLSFIFILYLLLNFNEFHSINIFYKKYEKLWVFFFKFQYNYILNAHIKGNKIKYKKKKIIFNETYCYNIYNVNKIQK